MTSCKYNNLTNLRKFLQKLLGIRPDVNSSINILPCWEFYLYLDIIGVIKAIIAMYQSFIQIQNYSIFVSCWL